MRLGFSLDVEGRVYPIYRAATNEAGAAGVGRNTTPPSCIISSILHGIRDPMDWSKKPGIKPAQGLARRFEVRGSNARKRLR